MHKILTLLFVLMASTVFAQTGIVKGKIIHEKSKLPYFDVTVTIPKAKVATITNASGDYLFSKIPYGTYDMIISSDGIEDVTVSVTVSNTVNEIETIELKEKENDILNNNNADNSTINVEDASSDDENSTGTSGQTVSSVLNSSRDPFMSAAMFGWGQYFFRMRGYENDNNTLFMNGVPMNDLEEGGVFFNSFSGLNDVFRGRSNSIGLAPIDINFGGLGQNTTLDATASNQRKGTRVTYTSTNRSYRNRLMVTHNSGLMKNGWAYSFSLSRRWANQGPIEGTYYDAYGYFASVEKRFKKQGFNLMLVGAPLERGKNGPATLEAFELAGTNYYNPYWGYQNGKVRNSRVFRAHQPMLILTHDYKFNTNTVLNTAISYQTGETSQTGLDWYNANDPRPDYYRNMPSYQDSADIRQSVYNDLKSNPEKLQIDWNQLYHANYLNKLGGNARSVYMLNENVEASNKLNASVNLQSVITKHAVLHAGFNYQSQNNHNFQRVNDLLGGDYWTNINQFAARTFGSNGAELNDLNTGLKQLKVGDTYGYDYNIHFSKANFFTQGVFTYNKFDFFLAGELGFTGFYREGNFRSGLYPSNSFGNSKKMNFLVGRAKGGFTYKLNGRNYLYVNGSTGTRAPFIDNVIISPRTRNSVITDPKVEKVNSMEVGYLLRTPNIKARATFFATEVQDAADIKRYYLAGSVENVDVSNSFANLVIQGINKRYTGLELGTEIKVTPSLSVNLAAALTQAFYTSRPYSYFNVDNDTSSIADNPLKFDTLYIKNYNVPSGPTSAFQASANYRGKRFWYATISCNYLANNWIDFAPNIRTKSGIDGVPYQSDRWNSLLEQKRLNNVFTVDLNMGKSYRLNQFSKKIPSKYFINFNLGINNLLNNKNIQLYGFENLRASREERSEPWFAPRYAYALGTTYFLNCVLRF